MWHFIFSYKAKKHLFLGGQGKHIWKTKKNTLKSSYSILKALGIIYEIFYVVRQNVVEMWEVNYVSRDTLLPTKDIHSCSKAFVVYYFVGYTTSRVYGD